MKHELHFTPSHIIVGGDDEQTGKPFGRMIWRGNLEMHLCHTVVKPQEVGETFYEYRHELEASSKSTERLNYTR